MSATSAMLILFAVWVVIGVVSAVVMGRRGHQPYVWAIAGVVLGPLVVPLMVSASRQARMASTPSAARPSSHGGALDVVVGVDGSEEATGALVRALALLGPLIGRFTIATVLDYDKASSNVPPSEHPAARALLSEPRQRARELLEREPDTVVLTGRPAEALAHYARQGGYDLIVVAPRGKGASRLVFGSVASRLARGVDMPIAILPPAGRDETPSEAG